MRSIDVSSHVNFDDHHVVKELIYKDKKVAGYIAIHSLINGRSVGGTRLTVYGSAELALSDALRLSRTMSMKCAIAGLEYGGAKGVLIADSIEKEKLLKSYTKDLNDLEGNFFTGEDVGISEADVQLMNLHSPYLIGKSSMAGDPSPFAAQSTYNAIKESAYCQFKKKNLNKVRIAVKGTGKVGHALCELLLKDGALLLIADVDDTAVLKTKRLSRLIQSTSSSQIHSADVDIFSPCALGNDITADNIDEIRAPLICGAANNQLENDQLAEELHERAITFVPDYLANAGGLINVVDELEQGGYTYARVLDRIERIKQKTRRVLIEAKKRHLPPVKIAKEIVDNFLDEHKEK
jgi:leucine dehydrogenase